MVLERRWFDRNGKMEATLSFYAIHRLDDERGLFCIVTTFNGDVDVLGASHMPKPKKDEIYCAGNYIQRGPTEIIEGNYRELEEAIKEFTSTGHLRKQIANHWRVQERVGVSLESYKTLQRQLKPQ